MLYAIIILNKQIYSYLVSQEGKQNNRALRAKPVTIVCYGPKGLVHHRKQLVHDIW